MKIITYNVNGIRSASEKGLIDWLEASSADIVCLQETKIEDGIYNEDRLRALGYETWWHSAEKKGYSGVAIFSKVKPLSVVRGSDMPIYDREGRFIRIDFEQFSILNVYIPSGSSGEERQAFKFQFLDDFYNYIEGLKKKIPNLIICGDFNICHLDIDIHNPSKQQKSSGFLPEERSWLSKFIASGFIDAFRFFNTEPHQYTWWSYRANARKKNLGWRIDYFMATQTLENRLKRCVILPQAIHSDHCPVLLETN